MSFANPSLYSRPRPMRRSNDRAADPELSSPDRMPRSRSRELVYSRHTSAALSRFTFRAAARLAGCAGSGAVHFMVAVLSWLLVEFLQGCAAYAQAMYPPIDIVDEELETAKRAAPVPFRPAAALAAEKPRLMLASSNRSVTQHPSRRE